MLRQQLIDASGPPLQRPLHLAHRSTDTTTATHLGEAFRRIQVVAAQRPVLAPWVEAVRTRGVVKRLAGGDPAPRRELLDAVTAIATALPAGGESLSAFAAARHRPGARA